MSAKDIISFRPHLCRLDEELHQTVLLSRTSRRGRQADNGEALEYDLRITSKIGIQNVIARCRD
jgi:hypothetical protein